MIIHVGSNEIPKVKPTILAGKIIDMYKRIKTLTPSTKLYHSHILPKIDESYLPGIRYVNNTVGNFCYGNDIKVINHQQFCEDFNLLSKYDFIHPTFKGTLTLAKKMIYVYRYYTTNTYE